MQHYLLFSVSSLGLSYLVYELLLKGEKTLVFNRCYLLVSLLVCLVGPALGLESTRAIPTVPKLELTNAGSFTPVTPDHEVGEKLREVERDVNYFLWTLMGCYGLITSLFLVRFIRNLWRMLYQVKQKRDTSFEGLCIVPVTQRGDPYSFFHYVFIHEKDLEDPEYRLSVLNHEAAHSRQYHSVDILLLEILSCFFWFNPFLWLYKRSFLINHEFQADDAVLAKGIDRDTYAAQLVRAGEQRNQLQLISGFNFIQTKKRLLMLHHTKSSMSTRIAKIAATLVLFTGIFFFGSFSEKTPGDPFVVVVDPGHGGHDTGSMNEKDVTLQISLALEKISEEQEIQVILLREKDEFLTLDQRVEKANRQQPDLFLSLHCSSHSDPSVSGMIATYSPKNEWREQSLRSSELLTEELLEITGEASIHKANFVVLRKSNVPAVMLHMGYLSNETEGSRLRTSEYQQQIAAQIYAGLQKIKESR